MQQFIAEEHTETGITPLSVLTTANFFQGLVCGEIGAPVPVSMIILATPENKIELVFLGGCPGCTLQELEEAITEKKWRPIAVDFSDDEENDFMHIDLHFFDEDPSEEDIALIDSMFVSDEPTNTSGTSEPTPLGE